MKVDCKVTARQKFLTAAVRDPGNPTIENNIKLLDGSYPFMTPPLWQAQVQ